MTKSFNMGWGNPYFLLDILDKELPYLAYAPSFKGMIYGPYEGTPELIEETRKVIKHVLDQSYKHILITNGASNAINLLLRHFAEGGGRTVYTTEYGYPSYEEMIKRAGLDRVRDLDKYPFNLGTSQLSMRLIDSPENPHGHQHSIGSADTDIWDAVYHSKIYTKDLETKPNHKYLVGSYSKLLGIAGFRIGFIATNDTLAYESLVKQLHNETTGVSRPSQEYLTKILKTIDLELFMLKGRRDLWNNKTEFQKIEYLFDRQKVNENGMFYCVKADPKAVDILDKAGIVYVRLDQDTIRLSMGQTITTTQEAIKAILKEDGK